MQTEPLFNMDSQEFFRNSTEIFARLRENEPVSKQGSQYGRPLWYVTRYEDVDEVLRDSQRFALDYRLAFTEEERASMPGDGSLMEMVNSHLLTKEGEDHRRLRALVSKVFTPRRIAELRPRIQAIADELIDQVAGQGQMNLVDDYAFPLPITVIAELLGIPVEDREKFREWSDDFITAPFRNIDDSEFIASAMGFVSYLGQLFEQRRQDPQDDLITGLLQAEEAGDRLNTEELFSMVILLIIAGHETTVSLIGNSVVALLTHPEVLRELQEKPELMPQAVEEFLRYESPVQRAITRWVTQDTQLGGQRLTRGDMVVAVLGSANRDSAAIQHPDALDIHREANPHMAFGKGAHYCLGAPLARMEGEIALNTLLRRLPGLRLAVDPAALVFRPSPLVHAYEQIPVRW